MSGGRTILARGGLRHRLKGILVSSLYPKAKSNGQKVSVRLPLRTSAEPTRYLAITAIVKNEGRYLHEWIEFHRLVGVEQIYLYDNGSDDSSAEVLAPFIAEGFVTLIPWVTFDEQISPQRQAYAHALCNFGPKFRWMAFIDLDEFLFPVSAPDLPSVLSTYEDCSSICVPWFMFGTSGHEMPPSGLVIENYTQRAHFPPPPERRKLLKWKSIVDPSQVVAVSNIHMFDLTGGVTGGIDERRMPVSDKAEIAPPPGAIIRINHYYTRSHQEFVTKLNTARFTMSGSSHRAHTHPRNRQRLRDMIEEETVRDEVILRFLPELRRRMELTSPASQQATIETTCSG